MSFSVSLKRFCFCLCFVPPAVFPVAHGASGDGPPALIAELAGQWTGESTRTLNGSPTSERSSNARRYWIEDSIVRGEILSSAGGKLEAAQVALLPREFGFVKILTLRGDVPDMFVGIPSEGGILWSAVDSDRIRYIERVADNGDGRQLEVLMVETVGEPAKLIETLLPSDDALTGVIGAEVQSVEEIQPLVLPPMAEMELVDRIGELTKQRDEARGDSGSTVRELAAAWRQCEELEARLAAQSAELAEVTARLESGESGGNDDEVGARLLTTESELTEARRWADDLEKSLGEQTARADAVEERVVLLEGDLLGMAAERDNLKSQVEQQTLDSELSSKQLAELQLLLDAEAEQRVAAQEALTGVQEQVGALTAENKSLSAAGEQLEEARKEIASLNRSVSDLEGKLEGMVPEADAAGFKTEHAAAAAALLAANSRIKNLEDEVAAAQEEAQKSSDELVELRAQLSETVADRDSLQAQLESLSVAGAESGESQALGEIEDVRAELASVRNQLAESETQLSALRDEYIRSTEESETSIANVLAERDSVLLELQLAKNRAEEADETIVSLESELSELNSAAAAEPDEITRVAELENRLAETYARSEQRQEEIEALQSNVTSLEAENQKLATRVADLAARVALERPEGTPMADTSVVANLERQLADEKSTRIKLEAANQALSVQLRELEIELAEARDLENQPATAPPAPAVVSTPVAAPAAKPVATVETESPPVVSFDSRTSPQRPSEPAVTTSNSPTAGTESTVSFRSPQPASSGATASGRRPPRRPDESQATSVGAPVAPTGNAGQNAFLVQIVRGLPLNGFRRAGADSLVVINGRTYRIGQVVDTQHGLRFTRIDSDSIVFSGPDDGEYRYTL